MTDRRLLRNFDYLLLLLALALSVFGLVIIFSATRGMDLPDPYFYVKRQAVWLGAGLIGVFLISLVNYVNFAAWARYIYLANLFLLGGVLFFGRGTDVKRWLDLGFVDIQPSEYAKLVLIIILARILAEQEGKLNERFTALIPAFIYTAIPMGLIFLQPDLGTAMVFIIIFFGTIYVAGVNRKYLLIMTGAGLAILPFLWSQLKYYQQLRLMVFLNPEMDPLGAGYQLMQSMIAVGSGGLWGKSLFEGTQVRLNFLPEQHTDFIFSVLGEELGFAGTAGLMLLFVLMIYRILWIGTQSKDLFGSLVCSGVAIMITFQVLVNVGMTIGIMPVTGLPLPFMSYGGNALLVNFLAIGLVINIGMRRQKIQF